MSFTGFPSIFFLLTFALPHHIVLAASPIFQKCSRNSFNPNEPFASNLNTLLNSLKSAAPASGFSMLTAGQSYGVALCGGGITVQDCRTCVEEATRAIGNLCPSRKAAIVWYDDCLLKYSDHNFLGNIDYENSYYQCNLLSAVDPPHFNQHVHDKLVSLARRTTDDPKLYKADEETIRKLGVLYGMAQCTRDLPKTECRKCLDSIAEKLRSQCDGKVGGQHGNGSCRIRYETYRFVKA